MAEDQTADIVAIQQVKGRYCWASDIAIHGTAAIGTLLDDMFTDDVHADYGFGPIEGAAALRAHMTDYPSSSLDGLWHSIHTPFILIEGDTAVANWTAYVRFQAKGSEEWIASHGRYRDEFRREGGVWRISRVQFLPERLAA